LSAKLAGALNGPVNGAALDDDFSEILAPETKKPAPSDPSGAAKPADAGSDGKDPLWFLRSPSAAAESDGPQAPAARTQPGEGAPAPTDEVKLSRPEVLRASLPPLFGAGEERPTNFRAPPVHAPKAPASGVPTAKMQPVPPLPSEVGKTAAGSVLTARTQPSMPPAQPTDETAKAAPPSAPPTRTDAGSSEAAPTAPVAREPAPIPEAAPPSVAEAAPGPQPLPEAKPADVSLGDVATDTAANKAPALMQEPSATKPAATADANQARTLEHVVGELLEPVIRHWLETNLPRMVEKVVRDEVARALAAERRGPKA
jgi:cell pole-organizing protein PopZ